MKNKFLIRLKVVRVNKEITNKKKCKKELENPKFVATEFDMYRKMRFAYKQYNKISDTNEDNYVFLLCKSGHFHAITFKYLLITGLIILYLTN